MKKLFLISLFFLPQILSAQHTQDSTWIMANYTKQETYIKVRDGIRLFTTVYAPKDSSEKHPILLTRTPYSCAPYGKNAWRANWNNFTRYYMREGYYIVYQDVRGRWMSEGEFADVRPFNPNKKSKDTDEATDTYDAIDWLVKNLPNNNGNVGVKGISYPGFYATMASLSGHPALKAVSPQAPVTDWFMGDDFHHNGAFFAMDAFNFYSGFGKPRPKPTTIGPNGFNFPTQDSYKFFLEAGALTNLSRMMGDSVAFWKELMKHPNYDEWWKARNPRNFVENISSNTATLIVGGLFDAEDCFGAWRLYGAIEKKAKNNNKIVMGPWYHGQWSSDDGSRLGNVRFGNNTAHWYQNQVELPFFNYYLKQQGKTNLPEATIFFTGENKWKEFAQWPPATRSDRPMYLQANGKLAWSNPNAGGGFSEYVSDPSKPVPYTEDVHSGRTAEYMTDDQRFASRRPDVLSYQTDVLTDNVTLGGTLIADLFVSMTGTDADFVVKLIDVFPPEFAYPDKQKHGDPNYMMDSYQMLVRGEIMRGKYRKSFENPSAFAPGKVEEVRFELPDVAHTFQKGHRIMVQIQSSWFPLSDRNPQKFMNIYEAKDSDFQKATIRIYHDGKNNSQVILPVIK